MTSRLQPRPRPALGRSARGCALAAVALAFTPAPAAALDVQIPRADAISGQYQEVADAVAPAAQPAAPAPPPVPVEAPAAAPIPPVDVADVSPNIAPKTDSNTTAPAQYQSEEPPAPAATDPPPPPKPDPAPAKPDPAPAKSASAPATQTAPSNVNVSIRIGSPGDDGPVIQINDAGGDTTVDLVQPVVGAAPTGSGSGSGGNSSGLPDDWEWKWTSACFGGDRSLAAWHWDWSCEGSPVADELPDLPAGVGPLSDGRLGEIVRDVGLDLPHALPPPVIEAMPWPVPGARRSAPRSPAPEPATHHRVPARAPAPASRAPTVTSVAPGPAWAPVAVAPSRVAASVRAGRAAEPKAEARDLAGSFGDGGGSLPSGPFGGGPGATASGGLAGFSILFGLWLAVLNAAIVLVIPFIRRRYRTGPGLRRPDPRAKRLERPG